MKTVLFISTEAANQFLYERVLKQHYAVQFTARCDGGTGQVDAVVYDLPKYLSPVDTAWLEALDMPVVVLTSDSRLPVPDTQRRLVLEYPVSGDQLLQALAWLGVMP